MQTPQEEVLAMAAQNFALLGRHLVCPKTHFERLSKGPETHIATIFYIAIQLFLVC